MALALALTTAGAAARAADPAQDALRDHDVYVSPRVAGAGAADQERALERVAARMAEAKRPVKLALVLGPVGSPSLAVYVRRLLVRLDYPGTLIVTNRGGTIATAGPRPTAEMTRALRAENVGRIRDPVLRLTRAADIAAPPEPDLDASGRRSLLVLLLVAAIGGAWAAALGAGRRMRDRRRDLADARARMRVCLDALRARAIAAGREGGGAEHALGAYADAVSALPEMTRVEEVEALALRVRAALDGIGSPADPFAGLCATDPAHGTAATSGGVCARCTAAILEGEEPEPRMLSERGRPVRFDGADYGEVLRPTVETPASSSA